MKHLNLLIFITLLGLYLLLSSNIKISTNFLEALFSKESTKLFEISRELGHSNDILIATKGFDDKGLDELHEIYAKLKEIKSINTIEIELVVPKEMREYFKKNYYLLADFNSTSLSNQDISKKLQVTYDEISTSMIYKPINTNDPLNLFNMNFESSNKYLELNDYGYILKATTDADTMNATQARELYAEIQSILKDYPQSISFAPFYFLVENSAYIKNDATKIIVLSSILLLVLYFVILKNYRLFFHTIIALGSSALSAILISSFMFENINILTLVFGISITTISVDYMFHYYFHNDFSKKGFIKQKRVLFGFITTFGVFLIFSFIDIKLFSQLALFSAVSLATAYLLFSYVFTYLEIKEPKITIINDNVKSFNPIYVSIISFLMLGYSYFNLEFDKNLSNLDYQNVKLLEVTQKFTDSLGKDKYKSIIISADTKEKLLQRYEEFSSKHPNMLGIGKFVYSKKKCQEKIDIFKNYDFKTLRQNISKEGLNIGFKDVFKNSYAEVDSLKCDMHVLKNMKFNITQLDNIFYTLALVEKDEMVVQSQQITVLNMSKILAENLNILKEKLLLFLTLSLIFIIAILFYIARFSLLYPLSYILFPLSVVLFSISLFSQLNIIHIFALMILIAIGIDYGIYMYKSISMNQTKIAIRYALVSTFAGFGVLIFSSVSALYSIGVVITLGIGSIFILLLYKREI
ncbi:MAG: hypothetical protein L3I99_03855 [Sulfurimonas sp.]|nr:hypothetical protein [Sulfurimonas sp.]